MLPKVFFSFLIFLTYHTAYNLIVRQECSPESRNSEEECPKNMNYVCAYFAGDLCGSELCEKQAINECFACKDPTVQYFINGECQSDKIYCEDSIRDFVDKDCDFTSRVRVCGYFTEGCLEGECAWERTQCSVCKDPLITYYRPWPCKADLVFLCEPDFCDSSYYQTVCLFKQGCQGDDCAETFSDMCGGCAEYPGSYFKPGPCEKDRITCDSESRTADCQDTGSDPVCAYFRTFGYDFGQNLHETTVDNACVACRDTTVDYYTPGPCQSQTDAKTFCLPDHNSVDCSSVADEIVCGFNGTLALNEYNNGCSACLDSSVAYYVPGVCQYNCPDPSYLGTDIANCNGSLIEPVCFYVYLWDEGETPSDASGQIEEVDSVTFVKRTIKNSCVGCYDLQYYQQWSYYYKGECENAQGIYCSNEPASYYYGTISPVCGILTEGCSDSSCRATFAEPLVACKFSSAVLYTPGYCPGDQGISCDPYKINFDTMCIRMDTYSIPVCGYSRLDCQDDSCRTTYDNQCYACSDTSVMFFTDGACEN